MSSGIEDSHGGEQAELFTRPHLDPRLASGYRGPTACQMVGITYRQLDYWARTHLVEPSIRSAAGPGSQRLYSFTDLLVLKIVKRLLAAGVSLHSIRLAVEHLRNHGQRDLAEITLLSDGVTIYECRSPEEITDLLRGGQAVFGIALGTTIRDISGTIHQFPTETETLPARPRSVPEPPRSPLPARLVG